MKGKKRGPEPELSQELIEYIKFFLSYRISMTELAEVLCISRATLHKYIRKIENGEI